MTDFEAQEVELRLQHMERGIKEIGKQFSSIQKSLDLIYNDRDLITDISEDIGKVRRLVVTSDQKHEKLTDQVINTVKKETHLVKAEVAVSSEEVADKVKTTIQTVTHSVLNGLHHSLKKEGHKLSFRSRIAKFFSFFKFNVKTVSV
jgi:hypothetical protein